MFKISCYFSIEDCNDSETKNLRKQTELDIKSISLDYEEIKDKIIIMLLSQKISRI